MRERRVSCLFKNDNKAILSRSKTHLLTLYFLDSGSYDTGFFDFFGFTPTTYDYLRDVSEIGLYK